jgi:hypothetical protein
MNPGATSPLRAAVKMYRRSVRAGAFACELVSRRPWLGARDAHWIAENLSALRGTAVETSGDVPADIAALIIAEPDATAALAVLAAAPLAAMGPSLRARAAPWWPRGTGAPVLLSTADTDELEHLAARGAHVVPVAVELICTPSSRPPRSLPWPPRAGVTRARLQFGAAIDLRPGQRGRDIAAIARAAIDSLAPRHANDRHRAEQQGD